MSEAATVKRKFQPSDIAYIIGCFLIMAFCLAELNVVSVLIPYMIDEFQMPITMVSAGVTVATVSSIVCGVLGARSMRKFGFKITAIIGSLGAMMESILYFFSVNVYIFWIASIFGGIGLAFATYALVGAFLSARFGTNAGPLITTVYGCTGFIVPVMIAYMRNIIPDVGWRTGSLYLAIVVGVVGVLANILLVRCPWSLGKGYIEEPHGGKPGEAKEATGLTGQEALKTTAFWLVGLGIIFGGVIYNGYLQFTTSYFKFVGNTDAEAQGFLMVLTTSGTIIILLSGYIQRFLGSKFLVIFMFVGAIIGIILTIMYASSMAPAMAVIGLILVTFCRPISALPSLLMPSMFGLKDIGVLLTWSLTFYYIGLSIGPILIGLIADLTGGNWGAAFGSLIVFAVVAFILFFLCVNLSPHKKRLAAEEAAKKQS